jgi:uncharacterized protein YoxC
VLQPLFAALQADPAATRVILERSWLDQFALIGQSLVSVLVLVLLVAATFTMLSLRKALDELSRLVRSTSSDITAAVHDAREMADELRRLTGRVRDTADVVSSGVRRVRDSASMVTDGVRRMRDRSERRDRPDRPPRPERAAGSDPTTDDEAVESVGEGSAVGERQERPDRGDRADRERRRRKRRNRGDRPRPSDGGGAPPAATGDKPSE